MAVTNFHGLYFVRPSEIYITFPESGVIEAIKAPSQPYLLNFLKRKHPFLCFIA